MKINSNFVATPSSMEKIEDSPKSLLNFQDGSYYIGKVGDGNVMQDEGAFTFQNKLRFEGTFKKGDFMVGTIYLNNKVTIKIAMETNNNKNVFKTLTLVTPSGDKVDCKINENSIDEVVATKSTTATNFSKNTKQKDADKPFHQFEKEAVKIDIYNESKDRNETVTFSPFKLEIKIERDSKKQENELLTTIFNFAVIPFSVKYSTSKTTSEEAVKRSIVIKSLVGHIWRARDETRPGLMEVFHRQIRVTLTSSFADCLNQKFKEDNEEKNIPTIIKGGNGQEISCPMIYSFFNADFADFIKKNIIN